MIKKEILDASYIEHFKYAKELSYYLDLKHPKRVRAEKAVNKIIDELKGVEFDRL